MAFGIKSVIVLKKEVDSEPIFNKKFLKTKIKLYGDEATDFHDKKVPKVDSNYTCLAVILIDFVLGKKWKLLSVSVFKKNEYTLKRNKGE